MATWPRKWPKMQFRPVWPGQMCSEYARRTSVPLTEHDTFVDLFTIIVLSNEC
jgi:hypothetical protein